MADPQQSTGAGTRFVINMIGVVGLVFGVLPIVRYLLQLDFFGFTTAPYDWLQLEGAARFLPPAMVLVVCIVAAYLLEKRLERS
ncbi:hypothetical protein FHX52_2613 [Humibacillus xanthopallidus]|uniref:Uncharacterized protein n=1 Tax=Humibacillus xanthopallidus TaxID=412689 RepID=A0A543PPB3_9MICO|nr:hypothetical protein [Humibacillus xanthopallidus]TQN45909.1 hypothetical protein FHX52_2613 [Humibacillus xanthopallidus]HET7801211.1 hypothetical protein [Humibacillus xanthopallidus]